MPRKPSAPSQVMELFLAVSESLGITSDIDLASLADAGPESVSNWRGGSVKEFKTQKLRSVIDGLTTRIRDLRRQAGVVGAQSTTRLHPVEIEEGSSPTDLHRQFRDRVGYDYLGHRFLYFEPQGGVAWENLIRIGYEQEAWLSGVASTAESWLSQTRGSDGAVRGAIARSLGLGRGSRGVGVDVVCLGPGEGAKECRVLSEILAAAGTGKGKLRWLTFMPVDVSIALLLKAAESARQLLADSPMGPDQRSVLPVVGDFEEGPLAFLDRLRSSGGETDDSVRLVLLLGNVLGNVRDEETFVRRKLWTIVRPGDLLWVEVGLRFDSPEDDPLNALTESKREETAGEANRRILLEGPYRRWASASGRRSLDLDLRVWVREGDESSRVPGSYNFCHDLVIRDEGRVVTMLYSRRYDLSELSSWFEQLGFTVEGLQKTRDSAGRLRVGHLLLRRLESEKA